MTGGVTFRCVTYCSATWRVLIPGFGRDLETPRKRPTPGMFIAAWGLGGRRPLSAST